MDQQLLRDLGGSRYAADCGCGSATLPWLGPVGTVPDTTRAELREQANRFANMLDQYLSKKLTGEGGKVS